MGNKKNEERPELCYSYLKPKDGPVFKGLEAQEIIYAKDQPEYIPLRTLRSEKNDRKVISRWTLTKDQREAIANGADIYLTLLTYGGPLQPIQMAIGTDKINTDWVKVCLLDQVISTGKVS